MMATGTHLKVVLHKLIKTVEAYAPEVRGSIFLVDPKRKRLRMGAAPSLPDFFNQAVDRTPIQMGLGCCGTAAFTGKRTIAEKISIHPYWVSVRDLAAKARLEACWSEPIYSSDRKVMGTFAFYLSEPGEPGQEEIELISQSADLAGIAIERDRAEKASRVNMGLQHVRIEILHMENEKDWVKVGLCFERELREVVRFNQSAICLVDLIAGEYTAYRIHDGKMIERVFDEVPLSLRQVIETQMPLYRRNRKEIVAHLDRVEPAVMSVVDVPFQGGTISINALEEYAFEADEIAVLEQFGQVMSEARRHLQYIAERKRVERIRWRNAELLRIQTELEERVEEGLLELVEQKAKSVQADRLRLLGEMAAGIAHELNQPLVGVRGIAEHSLIGLSRGWSTTDETLQERFQNIMDQADRMTNIINHVRMFAREAGKPERKRVQINDVAQSSIDMLSSQFRLRGVELESEFVTDLPEVEANPYSLEEVVLNLLNNARDAVETHSGLDGPPGVTLRTDVERRESGDVVLLEVQDNGPGISEEILARIWDPFFTTKDPDKGTGLGLPIARSIVEEFGGELSLVTEVGKGTKAVVSLPAAADTD